MSSSPPPEVAAAVGDENWAPYPDREPESAEPDSGDEEEGAGSRFPDFTWPGRMWRAGPHLIRVADWEPEAAAAELARIGWLRSHFGTVEVVVAVDSWVVSTIPEGFPGHHPELQPEPDKVPAALGATLRRLHDLDIDQCPFRRSWDELTDQLAAAVYEGRLSPQRLPAPYDRYEPERLVELVRLGPPKEEDLVVTHGSPVVSNLFHDGDRPSGVTGVHRLGVADRHLDLAIIHRSLQAAFGAEAVFGFYQGYGHTPKLVALDHYLLIDVMISALVPPGVG